MRHMFIHITFSYTCKTYQHTNKQLFRKVCAGNNMIISTEEKRYYPFSSKIQIKISFCSNLCRILYEVNRIWFFFIVVWTFVLLLDFPNQTRKKNNLLPKVFPSRDLSKNRTTQSPSDILRHKKQHFQK